MDYQFSKDIQSFAAPLVWAVSISYRELLWITSPIVCIYWKVVYKSLFRRTTDQRLYGVQVQDCMEYQSLKRYPKFCCTTSASSINQLQGVTMGYEFDSLYLLKSGIKKFVQKDYQSKIIWTTSPRLYGLPVQYYVNYQSKTGWTTSPKQ